MYLLITIQTYFQGKRVAVDLGESWIVMQYKVTITQELNTTELNLGKIVLKLANQNDLLTLTWL